MTRHGTEPQSPEPLANTPATQLIGQCVCMLRVCVCVKKYWIISLNIPVHKLVFL